MFRVFNKMCEKIYWKFRFFYNGDNVVSNFINKNRLSHKICEECMQLPCDYEKINIHDVSKKWENIFFDVCYYMGLNRKMAMFLINEMCVFNNWDHLHPTEEEKNKSNEALYKNFYYDVFYSSDRWCFDRLMRCQWKFRYWISNE